MTNTPILFLETLTCSRGEDGLSCRHGIKPPLTHSQYSQNLSKIFLLLRKLNKAFVYTLYNFGPFVGIKSDLR